MYMQSGSFTFLISKYGRTRYIGRSLTVLEEEDIIFTMLDRIY